MDTTFSKYIQINNTPVWISILSKHPSYIIIHSKKTLDISIDTILSTIHMHIPPNTITCTANTYGMVHKICQCIKRSNILSKCGIITFTTKMLYQCIREYDIYEEIYLGTLPIHTIPFHYIVYIEVCINDSMYYIAIEPSISNAFKAHIFMEHTHEDLIHLLQNRYTPNKILIEWYDI